MTNATATQISRATVDADGRSLLPGKILAPPFILDLRDAVWLTPKLNDILNRQLRKSKLDELTSLNALAKSLYSQRQRWRQTWQLKMAFAAINHEIK